MQSNVSSFGIVDFFDLIFFHLVAIVIVKNVCEMAH